jgi:sphinganine-1-phosphate aldolase
MFRTKPLRRYAIFAYSLWSGGYYVASSMAGSRGGVGIAGAWYSMVSIGRKRYTEMA